MANYALIDYDGYEEYMINHLDDWRHSCNLVVNARGTLGEEISDNIIIVKVSEFYTENNVEFSEEVYRYFLGKFELVRRCAQRWTVQEYIHDDFFIDVFKGFSKSVFLLKKQNVDMIFSGTSSPHHLYNLLFYLAGDFLSIRTVFLSQLFINNRLNLVLGLNKEIIPLRRKYQGDEIKVYVNGILDKEFIRPQYVSEFFNIWKYPSGSYLLFAIIKIIKSMAGSYIRMLRGIRNPGVTFFPVAMSYGYYFYKKVLVRAFEIRSLKKFYQGKVSRIEPGKYVVVFGPNQPEASSQPDAEEYSDVRLMIYHLKKTLSADVQIYYKEHPTIFLYFVGGLFVNISPDHRSKQFYSDLIDAGIKLIDNSLDSKSLINKSEFIVGINGTFVIEAAVLGKLAYYYGNAWYGNLPCAKRINYDYDFKNYKKDNLKNINCVNKIKKHLSMLNKNSLTNIFGIASLKKENGDISTFTEELGLLLNSYVKHI